MHDASQRRPVLLLATTRLHALINECIGALREFVDTPLDGSAAVENWLAERGAGDVDSASIEGVQQMQQLCKWYAHARAT